jgi:uncharacterized protein (TIGR00251 family)
MLGLELTPTKTGTLILIKAKANARENQINGAIAGMLKVSVSAAPEKGKANKSIVKLLSKTLSIPSSRFKIVAGDTSSLKKIVVLGISPEEVCKKLDLNSAQGD